MDGTYKIALLLKRQSQLSPSEFTRRWIDVGVVPPPGLLQYIHNAPADVEVPIENAPPAPYDGIDEFLFESIDAAAAWMKSDSFAAGWMPPRLALLGTPLQAVSGPLVDIWRQDQAPAADAIKIVTLPVRKNGMTMAAFAEHWTVTHANLALAGPEARKRLLRLASTPADRRTYGTIAPAPFDGIGIIHFDSRASLHQEFSSDHYRNVMAPDEPRFTSADDSRAMMVVESLVLPGVSG